MDRKTVAAEGDQNRILDIEEFKRNIEAVNRAKGRDKASLIKALLSQPGFRSHYHCGIPRRHVVGEFETFEHHHEYVTACKLSSFDWDILFMPKGYFQRDEKRFDVVLCREHIFLPADLKSLTTKNPDTIGNRIKEGSDQAPRVVVDINSDIDARTLIDGLKLGCQRNDGLVQVIVLYHSRCYSLKKDQILGNGIFDVLK